jgi:hypothetical protein
MRRGYEQQQQQWLQEQLLHHQCSGYYSRDFNSIACNSKGFNAVSATAATKKWQLKNVAA